MAIQIKADGTWAAEYEGPYQGLDVEHPETLISDKASPSFNNFMLRNAELRSRPQFIQGLAAPGTVGTVLGISSFIDINGTYHIVCWTQGGLFQYNPLHSPPWDYIFSAGGFFVANPTAYRTFANAIYWTNLGNFFSIQVPNMSFWDGLNAQTTFEQTFADGSTAFSVAGISLTDSPTVAGSLPGGPIMAGPLSIGAQFISELNNQIILANVSVLDQQSAIIYRFPNLIWWSANGLPMQWDPTQNTSAGFNPFLDVSDQIIGLAMLGIAGYIFRNFGITQMTPTGSAVTPWEFDHMWASDHGIGNVLQWSIAQYGPTAAFVSQDNIYTLSVTNAQPIGGTSRDAIFADIANATGKPVANIIPIFKAGYVYLTYQLLIPLATATRNWVYSFEDKNWAPWDVPPASSIGEITGVPNLV